METGPLAYRLGSDWAETVTNHVVAVAVDCYCHDCGDDVVVDDCGDGEKAVLVVATVTVVPIVMTMTLVVVHLVVDDDDGDASMVKCSVGEWRTVQWLMLVSMLS